MAAKIPTSFQSSPICQIGIYDPPLFAVGSGSVLKSLVSLVILSLSKDAEGDYEAGFDRLNLTVRFNEECSSKTIEQVRLSDDPKKLTAVIMVYEDAHCFGRVQKLYLKGQYLIIHP